jgi:hypothetical protein
VHAYETPPNSIRQTLVVPLVDCSRTCVEPCGNLLLWEIGGHMESTR